MKWNRYIFRTGRNSSQDAISNAVAIGKPGVTIATLAQDYAFGRDGVAAFKEALAKTGATLAAEEYAPTNTTDFTAAGQRNSSTPRPIAPSAKFSARTNNRIVIAAVCQPLAIRCLNIGWRATA